MSADTLIELAAILIAVYAILPRARRLEVGIRLRLLSAIGFTFGLLIILVLLYYPTLSALGFLPSWQMGSIELAPENVAFLVLLLMAVCAASMLAFPNLAPNQAARLRDLVEELLRTADFASLFSITERHLTRLLSICYLQLPIPRLRARLLRLSSVVPPIQEEAPGLPGRAIIGTRNTLSRFRAWIARRLLPVLPDYSDAANEINEAFRLIATDRKSIAAMATLRPYLALTLVDNRIPFAEILLDAYLRCLLRDNESVLYYEVRNNQNTSGIRNYLLPPRNRLLTFLFSDAKKAEDLGVWRPIGNELIQILDEAGRQAELDPGNLPMEDFAEEGKWKSPLYVGIAFFDIMVSTALYQGVQWHMFLWYYLHFTQRIVRNFRPPTAPDSDLAEWPNRYCYLLYTMTSALTDWIEAVRDLSPENPHTVLKRSDCVHENSSIPKSSIMVLCWSLKEVVLSSAVPDRFKSYLSDIVFRLYFDLTKEQPLDRFAQTIAACLTGSNSSDDRSFRQQLLFHFRSFDRLPYDSAQTEGFEAMLLR